MIRSKALRNFLDELEDWARNEVIDTENKANASGASEYFRESMKGSAQGKSIMASQIISKIRKHFRLDNE